MCRRIYDQMNKFPIDIIGNYGMQTAIHDNIVKDIKIVEDKLSLDPDRNRRRIYGAVYNKYCNDRSIAHNELVYIGDDYGLGGNDESVYLSDFNCLKFDNYLDFPRVVKDLICK